MCKEKKKTVSLTLPPELIEQIKERAENNDRSFSHEVMSLLKAALKKTT